MRAEDTGREVGDGEQGVQRAAVDAPADGQAEPVPADVRVRICRLCGECLVCRSYRMQVGSSRGIVYDICGDAVPGHGHGQIDPRLDAGHA